ncbi:MAG TPA: assimilatory sulfite reductase (NADPH) flavoprotein subunit [Thermomonas sp.]|nr:assimilatory sulfite reductase (NADPH) flavoprotein subunit [Thermomonas sp.]
MSLPATTLPTPLQPDTALALARLAEGLDSSALLWASGYLAGMARALPANTAAPAPVAATQPATIVYGSQTGNAKRAAEALLAKLQSANLPARLLRADAYPLRELADETLLYVVVSTQGDGDPPDDARSFLDFIEGRRAPALKKLRFAVLALGDSSYPQFCAIGRRIDQRLQSLGGERIADCADADLDVEAVSTPWTETVARLAGDLLKPAAPLATVTPLRPLAAAVAPHSRAKPFAAGVLANQRITFGAASKDVRHLELALDGSSLAYEPGDALGVWPRNPQRLVDAVLQATTLDGDADVRVGDESLPLREWLLGKRELTRVARPFLAALAERSGDEALAGVLQPEQAPALAALLSSQQAIDLLQRHRADWDAAALVAALRPLQPRLYSIASSRKIVGDEAHLTVAHVEYETDAGTRWGAASHLLATREEGETVPVYIEANERFRLPADAGRDIIMIGAGTGIAPFRGFVQERGAVGGNGRNWLFFGAPRQRSDFLYQLEWQRALKDGQLHRIDLAFSRDATPKTYVQQRIAEQARALHDWLQGGAHLYVCGAIAMAKDVHAALLDVVAAHNGGDREAATEFLDTLAREGRYARDVY